MGIIRLQQPWTRQPQGAVRVSDWSRTARLSHLMFGQFGYEYATGVNVPLSVASGSRSSTITPHGLGTEGDQGNSFDQTRQALLNGDFTVLYVGTETTNTFRSALLQSGAAGIGRFGLNFNDQFGFASGLMSMTLLQTGVNRSHARVADVVTSNNGTLRAYLWRRSGASVRAWIDGVERTVTTTGGFTGNPFAAGDILRAAGDSTDGGFQWGGPLLTTAIFQSALDPDVCARISTLQGQYDIIAPRRIYIPTAAALPTLTALTASMITATGARLTVTA